MTILSRKVNVGFVLERFSQQDCVAHRDGIAEQQDARQLWIVLDRFCREPHQGRRRQLLRRSLSARSGRNCVGSLAVQRGRVSTSPRVGEYDSRGERR